MNVEDVPGLPEAIAVLTGPLELPPADAEYIAKAVLAAATAPILAAGMADAADTARELARERPGAGWLTVSVHLDRVSQEIRQAIT